MKFNVKSLSFITIGEGLNINPAVGSFFTKKLMEK